MPERQRRPNLDERFSLDADPEHVLRHLLGADDPPDEDESAEDSES